MAGRTRRNRNGSIRQLDSGAWQLRLKVPGTRPPVYYPHPDGTFYTKAAAVKALQKHNEAIDAGTWVHPDAAREEAEHAKALEAARELTVAEAGAQWLDAAEAGRFGEMRRASLITYRSRIAQVNAEWGATRVFDVTEQDALSWFRKVAADSTRARALNLVDTLHRVLSFIAEEHPLIITASPVKIPEKERKLDRKSAGKLIPDEVVAAIAEHLPKPYQATVYAASWLGLRLGEVLGLHVDAFDDDTVRIFRNAQTKGGARIEEPKSRAGTRILPIPEPAREILAAQREASTSWLFPGVHDPDSPLSASTFGNYWRAAVAAARADGAKVPEGARFHDLRHTALTRFARAGATSADVLLVGGHDDPGVTANYQHAEVDRLREISSRLGKIR
jgi:integrase